MSTSLQALMAEIADLRRRQDAASTAQLAFSSIEDGALREYDIDGNPVAQYGKQFDGTHAAVSLSGPTPPTPTVPILTPAPGALLVRWDGEFTDALFAPMDFARVEVHASTTPDFDPSFATTLRATIETPRGVDVPLTLPLELHYVKFVARSLSGKPSAPSAQASGTPEASEATRIKTAETGKRVEIGTSPDGNLSVVEFHPTTLAEGWSPARVFASDWVSNTQPVAGVGIQSSTTTDDNGRYSAVETYPDMAVMTSMNDGRTAFSSVGVEPDGISLQSTTGPITSNKPITITENAWTAVPSGSYGTGVSAYSGTGYVAGIRWRRTHDNKVILQFGLKSDAALTSNPILMAASAGVPAPTIHGWAGARGLIGSANEVLPVAILADGRLQLLRSTGATYALIAGTIEYPLD